LTEMRFKISTQIQWFLFRHWQQATHRHSK